ncbi:DNA repair protein RecO [Bombilactobacillus thymidiniphilus]|uniref:DNA repair protein RecO n=1 Tax=Bombilactobacillus thymidiniphilus TaxID=2923363 RepID=A0ABY4PDB4_9LACO|nr:DNA repair protein RecO [Bombilactobacillus thymidiniphilus]UQS83544.1 DNA repair protein RecO [Bombilactobacillus thymidiniphilus]
MSLQRNQQFEGLVLRSQSYRDNDQMVWLMTADFGIKTFLIRGVKKQTSKKRYLGLPFSYGTYQGTINSQGFSYLIDGTTQQLEQVSQDIQLNAYITYINDLILRAFGSQIITTQWFQQIVQAEKLIDQGLDPEIITNIMEIQFLQPFGVTPNLQNCVICGEKTGLFDYSLVLSGILCQKHWSQDEHRLHLQPKVISYLRWFKQVDLFQVGGIKVPSKTKLQLRKTIDLIYNDSVSVYPKSKKFIDQMYQWQV